MRRLLPLEGMTTKYRMLLGVLALGVASGLGGCGGEAVLDDHEYDDETHLTTGEEEYGYENPRIQDDREGPIDEEGPIVETVEEVEGSDWDG